MLGQCFAIYNVLKGVDGRNARLNATDGTATYGARGMHRLLEDTDARHADAIDPPPLERVDSLTLDLEPTGDRVLGSIAPKESARDRAMWLVVILAWLTLSPFAVFSFWAPADGGIDQNAYLVGGKQIALTGSS